MSSRIDKITIEKFWGDKTVSFDLEDDINFLIGVNGSGKTTIINLIAATLKGDYETLARVQFKSIRIDLLPKKSSSGLTKKAFIEVGKEIDENAPYPQISYKIKGYNDKETRKYWLNEFEEDYLLRHTITYTAVGHRYKRITKSDDPTIRDVNKALQELVNVSWLSIHRVSSGIKLVDDKGYESSIDRKIEELQIDLVKYFSQLNRKYAIETERFQKFIFESLIEPPNTEVGLGYKQEIDPENEKDALRHIFRHFRLDERTTNNKLDKYFDKYDSTLQNMQSADTITFEDIAYHWGIRKIHTVVQQWNNVIEKQKQINKTKDTFFQILNSLFQRKALFVNDKNELYIETQSGKHFPLTNLSSGEKQLLIILGQSLLQEEGVHIYIADEPELSLHVEWQEKLVKSLKSLNPNSQIIFATHSPDIVGEYSAFVIKVEDAIR
ncbi:MAG: AAA family ATPase [Chitinophagaceae bacterium]|nr:AAA family ATPase [Chitinophagaceae bacterium]